MPTDIKSLARLELEAQFKLWAQPDYRVTQLLEWLYVRHATTWDAMTNLPKKLRGQLQENYSLQALELVRKQGSRDITQKFLWKLADGAFIESVLIPASPELFGEASDRLTLCVSTQVGCAYGCKFCASGLDGWKRNLTPKEIVEQILAIERWNENEVESRGSNIEGRTARPAPINSRQPADQQSRHHGHGRAAGQLRQFAPGAANHQRAVGRRHRRAEHHRLDQRTGPANPSAGGRAAAVPPRHFAARRDR